MPTRTILLLSAKVQGYAGNVYPRPCERMIQSKNARTELPVTSNYRLPRYLYDISSRPTAFGQLQIYVISLDPVERA
jgi:hypothetical protein